MTITVRVRARHRLSAAEAMARIRARAENLQAQYSLLIHDVHAEWGETMSLLRVNALARTFTATVETSGRSAVLQIEMPESASAVSDRLAGFVRRELRRTLSEADPDP